MKSKKRSKARKSNALNPSLMLTRIRRAVEKDLLRGINESTPDVRYRAIFREAMATSLTKKFVNRELRASGELELEAYKTFISMNDHMANFTMDQLNLPKTGDRPFSFIHNYKMNDYDKWFGPGHKDSDVRTWILLRSKALVYNLLGELPEDEWFSNCRLSSGSSIGVPFWDTSPERKFTSPVSTTKTVIERWRRYLCYDSHMAEAFVDLQKSQTQSGADMFNVVDKSRVTTVEKTNSTDRMIAVEPVLNMYFQLGLMQTMYDRLERVNLDVTRLPEEHKERALISSLSGREATIDWSSASDCVSTDLVKWLLPRGWWVAVNEVRTGAVEINGERIDLNMFATMGNATTFPLETIVLWSLAASCEDWYRCNQAYWDFSYDEFIRYRRVSEPDAAASVFGDDCIVSAEVAKLFIDVATSVGFIVNTDKSFVDPSERFRESCGGDYHSYRDVRPVYIKAPPQGGKRSIEAWLYNIHNQITKKYISYFGSDRYVYDRSFFRTMSHLFRECGFEVKLTAPWSPTDAGLQTFGDYTRLSREYDYPFQEVLTDPHGTLLVQNLEYKYWKPREKCDPLRYAMWLKNPIANQFYEGELRDWKLRRRIELHPLIRKRGSYVVTRKSLHFKL